MKTKTYQWILYTIIVVIIATISIQVYWNYKNYLSAKQELINDVQISLDKAVDDYYAILAEETTIGFSLKGDDQKDIFAEDGQFNKLINSIDEDGKKFTNLDTLESKTTEGIKLYRGRAVDSMMTENKAEKKPISMDSMKNLIHKYKKENPETESPDFKLLTSKITVSISNDSLDLERLDTIVHKELNRKSIDINYALLYKKEKNYDTISIQTNEGFSTALNETEILKSYSNSPFLPKGSELCISFSNSTLTIFNRIIGGIILSLVLVLVVIGCLYYLLHIIKNQKELAEVKNDLISNITHEFKTPIATIGVALESISNFNAIDDREKTKKYIDISTNHLNKLNTMVEKLLETATLNSGSLELNKQEIDLIPLLNTLIKSYQLQFTDKIFTTYFKIDSLEVYVDIFHFENAVNNILDNAVKYGGKSISMLLKQDNKNFQISISDDGNNLNKTHKQKIFEKFYRVPKGNTHNVKGFGIGLHYSKSIIEKHQGTIEVDLSQKLTTFKICMPYA